MDLDARPLRCFIAVAELNSFGRAADRMNVSQPALSVTIKELERRLGFTLFDRSSRRVALTAEGKLFLGNARRYVRESDILRQSSHEIRSNDLRISAAFHTSLIPERNALLEGFLCTHDDVNLQVLNDHQGSGFAKLARGEIDLLIAIEPEAPPSNIDQMTGPAGHAAIERIKLSSRQIGLLVPQEHRLAGRDSIQLDDLNDLEIVVPNRFHGVEVSEQIRFALTGANAQIVRPHEGHAIGVERFGALRRLPAVTLNWFSGGPYEGMVTHWVNGLGSTYLAVIRAVGEPRPSAARFWDFAARAAKRD